MRNQSEEQDFNICSKNKGKSGGLVKLVFTNIWFP